MKVIILVAGEGKRLRPFTEHKPKCMVMFCDKPIIEWQLSALRSCGISDITLVTGYKHECLDYLQLPQIYNEAYNTSNMVYSLMKAQQDIIASNDDIIISYGDIIYERNVLEKLMQSDAEISIVTDSNWLKLWSLRMDEPLQDAETLKFASDGSISELGKRPKSLKECSGQYIGLIKISRRVINRVIAKWQELSFSMTPHEHQNIFMTDFIQSLIDDKVNTMPVKISNGWIEIDTVQDLQRYTEKIKNKKIDTILNLRKI